MRINILLLNLAILTSNYLNAQCSVSIQVTDLRCFGTCAGTAQVKTLAGTNPFTYLWSTGNTTWRSTGLCPGTYTVTATDATACSVTKTVIITEPTLLTVTTSIVQDISCFGTCDGKIVASPSGGTSGYPGYRYTWSSGISGATASNLCATEYTVNVIDGNGCYAHTSQLPLSKPTKIIVTTSSTSATNGNANGNASVFASGGNPPYSYFWDPSGATSQTINGITCTTTFTVTVTDYNGCSSSSTTVVTCATGIREPDDGTGFNLYPNPATSNITLETITNKPYTVQIINLLGETVYNTEPTVNKINIDVGILPKGIYIVQLIYEHNNISSRQRFVIE